jgi:NADH-quinone oxidoreductase subunit I
LNQNRRHNPFVQYFADIWAGVATTYLGMRLTIGYFFGRKFTMLYPEERPVIPPGHRGLHGYDESKCILCQLCVTTCPVGCITLEAVGKGKDGMVTRYDVDYSACLFCNLCAEACPTKCVWLSEKYDLACGSRGECVLRLAHPKTDSEIAAHKDLLARKEAEKKAKQQEAPGAA